MKAMLLESTGPVSASPLALREVADPRPGPGQIRIRVHVCGVCHTDLHTVEGELGREKLPVIPGHQVVGSVESLGADVRGVGVGDRVGVAWLHRTCGTCAFCRRGDENLCGDARFTGLDANGGYAEYLTIDHDFAYEVPEGMSDGEIAPLLCAGIIGYRSLRLSGIRRGGRLGLYGFGASAHVVIQIAAHWKCRVYVFSRGEGHRELARQLGAVWTGRSEEAPPEKLDAGIVFAPDGGVVPHALEHVDRGGTVALAGIHMSPIPSLDYAKHLYYERTLRSVTASTRRHGRELLALAAEIPIRTRVQTYPLVDANRALRDLKEGRVQGAAVLRVAGSG